jgi:hypothetical protein
VRQQNPDQILCSKTIACKAPAVLNSGLFLPPLFVTLKPLDAHVDTTKIWTPFTNDHLFPKNRRTRPCCPTWGRCVLMQGVVFVLIFGGNGLW